MDAPVLKFTSVQTFTGGDTHEGPSFAITAGRIYICEATHGSSGGAGTPSGAMSIADSFGADLGVWTQIQETPQTSGLGIALRKTTWWALAANNNASGTITVTGADAPIAFTMSVVEQNGQHGTPITQSAENSATDTNTTLAVGLGSAPSSTASVIGSVSNEDTDASGAIAPSDADFTELGSSEFSTATGFGAEIRVQWQYRVNAGSAGQTCDWSGLLGSDSAKVGHAIEVAAAGGLSVSLPTVTVASSLTALVVPPIVTVPEVTAVLGVQVLTPVGSGLNVALPAVTITTTLEGLVPRRDILVPFISMSLMAGSSLEVINILPTIAITTTVLTQGAGSVLVSLPVVTMLLGVQGLPVGGNVTLPHASMSLSVQQFNIAETFPIVSMALAAQGFAQRVGLPVVTMVLVPTTLTPPVTAGISSGLTKITTITNIIGIT